jgi:hypothetical protein
MTSSSIIKGVGFSKYSNSIRLKLIINNVEHNASFINVLKDTELEFKFNELKENTGSKGTFWISFTGEFNFVEITQEITLIGNYFYVKIKIQ